MNNSFVSLVSSGNSIRVLLEGGLEELMLFFLLGADQDVRKQAQEFVRQEHVARAVMEFLQLKNMIRLRLVLQLGISATKTDPRHSRFQHSKCDGACAVAIGMKIGLSDIELLIQFFVAFSHDWGHTAFSHTGETSLSVYGCESHEDRSIRLLRGDQDALRIMKSVGVEMEDVVAGIEEKGRLGRIQGIADSLGYIVADSAIAGCGNVPERFAWQVIRTLHSITETKIVVTDRDPWQEFVDHRQRLYHALYICADTRTAEAALHLAIRYAIDAKKFTKEQVIRGTDQVVFAALVQVLENDSSTPRSILSALKLASGNMDELSRWSRTSDHGVPGLVIRVPGGGYRRKSYEVSVHRVGDWIISPSKSIVDNEPPRTLVYTG